MGDKLWKLLSPIVEVRFFEPAKQRAVIEGWWD
jgi:hypothetical protein